VSKDEIARVKAEWEAKEAQKKEKVKASGDKGAAEGTGKNKDENDKKDNKSSSPPVPGTLPSSSVTPATPTHKRYSLHRDFYAMRQAEHRRRRQTKQMHELVPRLPGAPHGSLMG